MSAAATLGKQLRYAISSHVNYRSIALPRLLKSLVETNGIEPERILVVVGGATERRVERVEGIEHRFVDHNSLDLTALIEILDSRLEGSHWCLLHDTTEAGPRFARVMEGLSTDWEHIALEHVGWTNMGVFRSDFLQANHNFLMRCRNLGKVRAMMAERMFLAMGHATTVEKGAYQIQGERQVYGPEGANRRIVYFPTADLYKYMANFTDIKENETGVISP